MAYDLEEQEQIESLKDWWRRYGNLLTWVLIAAMAAYAGWSGWNYYQRSQAAQAGQLYDEIGKAVAAKDTSRVLRVAADMREKFGRTAYAEMAALTAAKAAFDANDLAGAKANLQWVVDSGRDEEYRAIARIRLAGVLLDEKAYDEGLKVLAADVPAAFAGPVADRRGDLLMAQNKIAEARTAYQEALQKSDARSPGRQLIQLKLDAIGGAKAA
jgi:predicted negative regulator of RcsB-dependent stress response